MSKSNIEVEIIATAKVCEPDVPTKDGEWCLRVQDNGDVEIIAPCGESTDIVPGRKGKFFKDIVKAYEKCAKATGTWDTKAEEFSGMEDDEKESVYKCHTCDYSLANCCC